MQGDSKDSDWCAEDSDWNNDDKFCEIREYDIKNSNDPIVVEASKNGGISVEGWDRNEIRILAKIVTNGRSESDAEALAKDIDVNIRGNRISTSGPDRESSRKSGYSVSFRLMVPTSSDLDLEAHNGGISIDGVAGDLKFSTVNGGVKLRDVSGDVDGNTTNGGLDIKLNGSKWNGSGLNVSTVNGGVRLSVPEDFSAELHMSTVNGSMKTDFPITVKGDIGRTLRTVLGDGGASLRIKTTNGGVRITKA